MAYIFTFMGGTFFGVLVMCCMVSAGRADDREEKWFNGRSDRKASGD